jgi:DNA-binding transcriptional regulator of glucitol operon
MADSRVSRREESERGRRTALVVLAVVVAVVLIIGAWAYVRAQDTRTPASPSFELASVGVTFVGSGASGVVAQNVCENECPYSAEAGEQFDLNLWISVLNPSDTCSPSYLISQLAGPSTGAFVVGSYSAAVADADYGSSVTIPWCSSSGNVFAAEYTIGITVVDQGASMQTLPLTVTVSAE